jgi:hypothetical protein
VIAKAETFEEDQKFIGQMAGVHFENIQAHKSEGGSTKDQTRKYFGQLDKHTIDQLYKFYQVDFEMFGYSPALYLACANDTDKNMIVDREPSDHDTSLHSN